MKIPAKKIRNIEKPIKPDKVWPSTINEAVRYMLDMMSEADKTVLWNTAKNNLIEYHFGLGMYIRNQLGLWGENKKLFDSMKWPCDPDDLSMIIIEAMWKELQRK